MTLLRLDGQGQAVPELQPRPTRGSRRPELNTRAWRKRAKAQVAREPWCAICGQEGDVDLDGLQNPLAADHVIRGESALQTLCRRCNGRKQ